MPLPNVRHVALLLLVGAAAAPAAGHQDVERVADGVYAVIRHDPIAFVNNANSLIVVCDSDVVVVDAQFTRAATLEVLGAIRRITPKPVRYVINTHWHDDHVAGNQVYADSFPGVAFVAQENTRADLIALGRGNRKATVSAAIPFAARFRRLMAQGLGGDSTPLVPLERAALSSVDTIARQYAAEAPRFRETLPNVVFRDRLTLHRGSRTIDVRWFGPANTRGDAVVWIPDARVVATGDLLVAPVPFAFNSYVGGWIGALDSVRALQPVVIVPGHGPLMRDDGYLRQVRDMLAAVREGTAAVAARGGSLADARKEVTLDDVRRRVAGDDKWLSVIFRSFFLGPSVDRAYGEAKSAGGDSSRASPRPGRH